MILIKSNLLQVFTFKRVNDYEDSFLKIFLILFLCLLSGNILAQVNPNNQNNSAADSALLKQLEQQMQSSQPPT